MKCQRHQAIYGPFWENPGELMPEVINPLTLIVAVWVQL